MENKRKPAVLPALTPEMEQARELAAQGQLREALVISLGALVQALNHLKDSLLELQMNLKVVQQQMNHEAPALQKSSEVLSAQIQKQKLLLLH